MLDEAEASFCLSDGNMTYHKFVDISANDGPLPHSTPTTEHNYSDTQEIYVFPCLAFLLFLQLVFSVLFCGDLALA